MPPQILSSSSNEVITQSRPSPTSPTRRSNLNLKMRYNTANTKTASMHHQHQQQQMNDHYDQRRTEMNADDADIAAGTVSSSASSFSASSSTPAIGQDPFDTNKKTNASTYGNGLKNMFNQKQYNYHVIHVENNFTDTATNATNHQHHQIHNVNQRHHHHHHDQEQQFQMTSNSNSAAISTSPPPPSSSPSSKNKNYILILGINISNLSRKYQFLLCASGVFSFSLLYGYLQELISVTLCNRQLGLFLAMMQFLGYSIWSKVFHSLVQSKTRKHHNHHNHHHPNNTTTITTNLTEHKKVPMKLYIFLSILRAIDASMTNMAMVYVNYPAKTLMKSSRVVFTMLFGAIIRRKKYKIIDYIVVSLMVSGLGIFMHADSKSSAIFQPLGIMMLTTSLLCDGAINNMSEAIMIQYNVGQDEFIYHLYTIATVGIAAAAYIRGDLHDGIQYIIQPGTWDEIQNNIPPSSSPSSWTVVGKFIVLVLFSSTGFFGSSCSALITKEFGALTMSITSTARKATTLFLSFALFNNVCTFEHVSGIVLFMAALVAKSLRASGFKGFGGKRNEKNTKGHGGVDSGGDGDINDAEDSDIPNLNTNVKRRRGRRNVRNGEAYIANIV